jgi:hypothetical protein
MGWNEVMDGFARHKQLKGKWAQEGLRFLRFYGQKPKAFREFVFGVYLRRFLALAVAVMVPLILLLTLAFFRTTGFLVASSTFAAALISYKFTQVMIRRQKLLRPPPGEETA